ncbi:DUF975 family protein [Anaerostipes sp.]|uniref:DUF975 family protein n=1 Tax=Anaerostipes sp. TaxID=1872530 RepID=UPI0025B7C857|nr:DUF975 family protein [Anaerostipes sp.]MBS7006990.1 DUF975 family protein [Anaerostipes sp.]
MKIREIIDTAGRRVKEDWKRLALFQLVIIFVFLALTILEYALSRRVRMQSLKLLISFTLNLLKLLLTGGAAYGFMKAAVGEEVKVQDMFFVFWYDALTYTAVNLKIVLMFAAVIIIGLRWISGLFFYAYTFTAALVVTYVLAACIWMFFRFRYFLSIYLLIDGEEVTSKWALKRSARMMEGNYIRLIGLQLFFLPFILLSVLTCGIGFLFVLPWNNVANALFYMDLICKDKKLEEQI